MKALLDTCVLVQVMARELLFTAAREALFTPLWSARIEEEWRHVAGKKYPEEDQALRLAQISGEQALARAAFPAAVVTGWEPLELALDLPDLADRHVLAAAITAQADILVTDNLRDFPKRALAAHGLERANADGFLRALAEREPEKMALVLEKIYMQASIPSEQRVAALKRGRLPRLAKWVRVYDMS